EQPREGGRARSQLSSYEPPRQRCHDPIAERALLDQWCQRCRREHRLPTEGGVKLLVALLSTRVYLLTSTSDFTRLFAPEGDQRIDVRRTIRRQIGGNGTHPGQTFVPGHGDLGRSQDVDAFREYLATLRTLVSEAQAKGKAGDMLVETVLPALRE